jgi:hypothetical protein
MYTWKCHNATPWHSYLKQTKMPYPSIKMRTGRQNRSYLEVSTSGSGGHKERGENVNMVEIFHTHLCKWKNETS